MRELFWPLFILIVLLGVLAWGLSQDAARQKSALDQCYMQVKGGQKKPIDCRLMKLEFDIHNAQTRSNMAIGAAVGASVGVAMVSRWRRGNVEIEGE